MLYPYDVSFLCVNSWLNEFQLLTSDFVGYELVTLSKVDGVDVNHELGNEVLGL